MDTLKKLLVFIRPFRGRLIIAFIGTAIFTALSVIPPLIYKFLADRVVTPGVWYFLPWVVLGLILLPVATAAIRFVNDRILILASQRFLMSLRVAMYEKIIALDMHYHVNKSSGALVGRLMDDVNRLYRLMTDDTIRIIIDSIVFIFSITVAFFISWKLSILVLLMVGSYAGIYTFFSKRIKAASQSFRSLYDQISGRLAEVISGIRQVRIYNREDEETTHFLQRTSQSLDQSFKSSMYSTTLGVACFGIAGFGSTLICWLGARYVLHGEMTYGDLHALNSYLWMAINPAVRLVSLAGSLNETFVSVDRIMEVLDEDVNIRPSDGKRHRLTKGSVEFSNIHFSYQPTEPLFSGLSLNVAAFSTVALVGSTGCGKTTLTSLLMRFWDVEKGRISIDGVDIRGIELKTLRRLFGVVPQDPLIFEGTIAENIAYGDPSATRDRIEAAAMAAEIYTMAISFPDGFDTLIGPRGIKLSTGEKQRLSIARAILKEPLILIMDEATSSLDSNSEALIQRAIGRLLLNRTGFVIAHRLSTIVSADCIVAMERGSIVEQGTHDELMHSSRGLYRRHYEEMLGKHEGTLL